MKNFFDGVQCGIHHHHLVPACRFPFAGLGCGTSWGKFMITKGLWIGIRCRTGPLKIFGGPSFAGGRKAVQFFFPKTRFEHLFAQTR